LASASSEVSGRTVLSAVVTSVLSRPPNQGTTSAAIRPSRTPCAARWWLISA